MTDSPASSRYRFGAFELDCAQGELLKEGRRVHLQGQPLVILTALLERRGEVVTREELRRRLWPDDTFVDFDHSLNTAVKRLREALGDEASSPRFIETLARRGYRFVAPAQRLERTPLPASGGAAELGVLPPQPTRWTTLTRWMAPRPLPVALLALAVLAIVLGAASKWPVGSSVSPPGKASLRLAVLPFDNLTGDADRDWVSDGLTEELVGQLGRLAPQSLGVIARSTVMHFKKDRPPIARIAEALSVDYVTEGSVRRTADVYRVAVRLIRVPEETPLWSELYEGSVLDLVALQREVAQQVARRLALTLLPEEHAALARATTRDPRACDAYLQGRYLLAQGPTQGLLRSADLFRRSVELDPGFTLAYVGLAEAHLLQQDYFLVSPAEAYGPAKAAALKALALDAGLADTHSVVGDVLSLANENPAEAERAFRRALEINPSHAHTHLRYTWHLLKHDRVAEASVQLDQALAIDPRSADIVTARAWIELMARRFEAASRLAREALAYQPDFPFARYVLGHVALRSGRPLDAIPEFERARRASDGASKYAIALTVAHIAAGHLQDARRMRAELGTLAGERYVDPAALADLDAKLGAAESEGTRASSPL